MQEVVEIVRHSVEVEEHIQVLVEVTLVIHAVIQEVEVVRHSVDVDEQIQVDVDV